MTKWWFHNRITVGDRKLEPDQDRWVLHESERETVILWKNHDDYLDVDWLRLDGIEYQSSDAAFEEGRRWRQYLSVAFARAGIAIDMDPVPLPQPRRMSTAQRIPKCLACGNRLGIRVDSHPSEDFRARITQWRQHPQDTYDLNVLPRDTQTGIDQLIYPGVSGGRRVRESLSGGQEFVDLDVMIGCDLEDQSSSTSMCSGDSPTASSRTACTEHHA